MQKKQAIVHIPRSTALHFSICQQHAVVFSRAQSDLVDRFYAELKQKHDQRNLICSTSPTSNRPLFSISPCLADFEDINAEFARNFQAMTKFSPNIDLDLTRRGYDINPLKVRQQSNPQNTSFPGVLSVTNT